MNSYHDDFCRWCDDTSQYQALKAPMQLRKLVGIGSYGAPLNEETQIDWDVYNLEEILDSIMYSYPFRDEPGYQEHYQNLLNYANFLAKRIEARADLM